MQAGSDNGNGPAAADGVLHVAFVLDKSGSMQAVEEAVVEGYNDYLRELREQGGETLFSLTTFDTTLRARLRRRAARERGRARPPQSTGPTACTALYDAIGHTVLRTDQRLQAEGRGEEKVLVVVMTDGLENSSTDYDAHAIAELVRAYDERPNWTFVYLGAGHDTIQAAQNAAAPMGFKADNAMRWSADAASTRKSMRSLADATAGASPRRRAEERALLRRRRPVAGRLPGGGAEASEVSARAAADADPPPRPRRRPALIGPEEAGMSHSRGSIGS